MRNFLRIAQGIDVMPLHLALQARPELWNTNRLRTSAPHSAHRAVDDILLRYCEVGPSSTVQSVLDDLEAVNLPAMWALPQARALVFALMARVEGERLGRVVITRLPPGAAIAPHEDQGAAAAYFDRFHVVIQAGPGCVFRCGDEIVEMQPGEAWHFNNCIEHAVENGNPVFDRIHLIADIRTSK